MERFPWGQIMRHGIVTLRIPPRDFWMCTLRELVPLRDQGGLSRGALDELMKDWPDE